MLPLYGEPAKTELVTETLFVGGFEQLRSESFVNREGTDYGLRERTFEQKVADVMRQLENGEAAIVFDAADESINIVASAER